MNISNIYRDRTLDMMNEENVGETVRVAGWVENIRDHGGVSFIDLRDMYGVLQVVMRDTTLLEGINKEDCISLEGVIEHRDEETYNPKIPTGTIELEAHKVDLLGKVYKQLPFEVMTSKENHENVRLKYRYLDLRNKKVKDNMIFRSKVISFLRQKMTDMGFLEIQTPILCASSPEGARDYIVPSRKYKGKFYALPQAPQQYKQLLMVSGFDPVISYKQAMLEFGSDKPDLRNPLRIVDVTDFFQRCTFKPFHGQTVRAIKVSNKMSKGFHEKLLKFATSIGMGGLGYLEVKEDLSYKGPIDKFIPDDMKAEIREIAGLKGGDTIFFIADKEKQAALYAGQLRNELGQRLDLLEKNAYRFCFINDFPMYEYDEEQKKIIFTHNPFSMPQGGLEALTTKDPLELLAYQYDIVCNGVELSSGAVRNHNLDIMVKAFEIAGYTEEDLKEKFGALYNAFQYGAPPHAGMAPGVDRMIMLLRNEENIREVIPFPMNGNAQDVMCGAPNEVSEMQLREVHIKVRK